MSQYCAQCQEEIEDDEFDFEQNICNDCMDINEEYPPIPQGTKCDNCGSPTAEYYGGDDVLCETCHDDYVDGYRERD
ncbi:hypothetical protein [Neisseria sp. 83E34]|uniref:hypothetical protein n=1 Tax=Neisseria sp. 83E34 TaxID=1692264 RepID=UPI0006CE6CED|nr:hypothetical protein [Neisseria sp. 83E34]